MFPTNRGICFSLKAIPNGMKTLDSCTDGAQSRHDRSSDKSEDCWVTYAFVLNYFNVLRGWGNQLIGVDGQFQERLLPSPTWRQILRFALPTRRQNVEIRRRTWK